MCAMPATETPERKLTYEDLAKIPDDGMRHEILDGVHFVSPSPVPRHQEIVGELHLSIGLFLKENPVGRVYLGPTDVELAVHDILVPDLLFVSNQRREQIGSTCVHGAPDLVIEVHSSNKRYDVITKRARYQATGVPEYWLVDPELESIEVLRLDTDGVYQTAQRLARHTGGGVVESPLLPGLKLDLDEVFAAA